MRIVKELLIVGAGHAHLEVLRRFAATPPPDARLTLLTREVHTPYSGMLPGVVEGHYGFADAHIDARLLAQRAGAMWVEGTATGIDTHNRKILRAVGEPLAYDVVSLDIGAAPSLASTQGAAVHAIPVKPIGAFLAKFDAMLERIRQRGFRASVAVVGGGAGGVELLLSMERRLRREAAGAGSQLKFSLISGEGGVLPGFPATMRRKVASRLLERGIEVRNVRVVKLTAGRLHLDDGSDVEADEILWATEAAASAWLGETGLKLDARGFLAIDAFLRCDGHSDIFAVGDTAAFLPRELPKAGVFAVRQGPVLANNLCAALRGAPLRRFRPQREALYILSTGERHAIATRNGFVIEGHWVWRLKDWIDRRFMARYR